MSDGENIIYSSEELDPIHDAYGQAIYKGLSNGGSRVALVDAVSGKERTYCTLKLQSLILANYFKEYGLKQGDVISIYAPNSFDVFIPMMSAFYLGIIVAPINNAYVPREIVHALNISKPKIVFCIANTLNNMLIAKDNIPSIEKIILIGASRIKGIECLEDILLSTNPLPENEILNIDQEQCAAIIYSSGTTGQSKGVMLTQKGLLAGLSVLRSKAYEYKCCKITNLGIVPYFHGYGLNLYLTAIITNVKTVLMAKFEEKLFLSSIEKYRVTHTSVVPPIVIFLAKSPLVDEYDLSSLKELVCAAAPLKKEMHELAIKRLKLKYLRQNYGLSESTYAVTLTKGTGKYGSVGVLTPGAIGKIVDPETGRALGPNEKGEICIKGALIMKGYCHNVKATETSIDQEGWLHTGDIGFYDKDQQFYVVDRIKDIIKFKGFQVPPAEIEGLLLTHPKIKDVAVVGLSHEKYGELPVAFVVKVPEESISEEKIINYIADNISYHKRLHGGVRFVDEIPKSPSGKILRRMLKERLHDNPT